jgi:2-keto-4-pentenoate hydratase/2-oxohepta-3-ene-1,7-dioic acid hydratase in catechol pathway
MADPPSSVSAPTVPQAGAGGSTGTGGGAVSRGCGQPRAGKLAAHGRPLREGDDVVTGSFVRRFALGPGDRAEAEFAGIGTVSATVAA